MKGTQCPHGFVCKGYPLFCNLVTTGRCKSPLPRTGCSGGTCTSTGLTSTNACQSGTYGNYSSSSPTNGDKWNCRSSNSNHDMTCYRCDNATFIYGTAKSDYCDNGVVRYKNANTCTANGRRTCVSGDSNSCAGGQCVGQCPTNPTTVNSCTYGTAISKKSISNGDEWKCQGAGNGTTSGVCRKCDAGYTWSGTACTPDCTNASAPTVSSITAGNAQCTVTLTTPETSKYTYYYKKTATDTQTEATITNNQFTITGLTNGDAYSSIKVGRKNSTGTCDTIAWISAPSCTPVGPQCPAGSVNWSVVNGSWLYSCSGTRPATNVGSNGIATDSTGLSTGSATYRCNNNATWNNTPSSKTCGATCTATTKSNCTLSATSHGGTSGTCASGYTGSCSYTCNNGTWGSPSSNSCGSGGGTTCPATTISGCVLSETSYGGTSGSCSSSGSAPTPATTAPGEARVVIHALLIL